MEYDSLAVKIKVLVLSFILVVAVVIMCFLDKEIAWGLEKILSCIVLSVFAFFFPPTVKYIINWFKNISIEEAIYVGYKIGYYGIIPLILIDPIVGVMYFINKRFKTNNRSGRNVIMVGWYIVN